ncbi:MAG: hypothetical protein Q7N95_06560 [Alphaproteobacteria bacterium]|nr:hypothetical protein [Alphaproteobacteria bacterium]
MRKTIIVALAAISFASIASSSQAGYEVRDHRRSAPPVAKNGQGGVTVTAAPVKCIVIRDDKWTFRRKCPK